MTFRAIPCPCGNSFCRAWMVSPVAAVQGVTFEKWQANLVCEVLNSANEDAPKCWCCNKSVYEIFAGTTSFDGYDTPTEWAHAKGFDYDPESNTFVCEACRKDGKHILRVESADRTD